MHEHLNKIYILNLPALLMAKTVALTLCHKEQKNYCLPSINDTFVIRSPISRANKVCCTSMEQQQQETVAICISHSL